MAWFHFDHETPEKLQVIELAALLKLPRPHVLGALTLVWRWFSEQTVTGVAGTTPDTLDIVAETPGFGAALEHVGWLSRSPDGKGIVMPGFDRYTGSAHERRRKQRQRSNRAIPSVPAVAVTVPAVAVTVPTQMQIQSQKKRREPSLRSGSQLQGSRGQGSRGSARAVLMLAAMGTWEEAWKGRHGVVWKGWDVKQKAAIKACFIRTERSPEGLQALAESFLASPPFKWHENPCPVGLRDCFDSVVAGLNGTAYAAKPLLMRDPDREVRDDIERVKREIAQRGHNGHE